MREEVQKHPESARVAAWQVFEKSWSYRDSRDSQRFQYFSGTSTFYRQGRVGTAENEIAWPRWPTSISI
jgi:hypothetical protein